MVTNHTKKINIPSQVYCVCFPPLYFVQKSIHWRSSGTLSLYQYSGLIHCIDTLYHTVDWYNTLYWYTIIRWIWYNTLYWYSVSQWIDTIHCISTVYYTVDWYNIIHCVDTMYYTVCYTIVYWYNALYSVLITMHYTVYWYNAIHYQYIWIGPPSAPALHFKSSRAGSQDWNREVLWMLYIARWK